MLTALDVANLALANTGEGLSISSFEDESREARACKQFYLVTRNSTLKGYDWNFAHKEEIPLTLFKANPHPDWNYSYGYPADCLRVLYFANNDIYIPVVNDQGRAALYGNVMNATLTYTTSQLVDSYPDDFGLAWSYQLAIAIAPTLTEGNIRTLLTSLEVLYSKAMGVATENNANEAGPQRFQDPAVDAGGFYGIYP